MAIYFTNVNERRPSSRSVCLGVSGTARRWRAVVTGLWAGWSGVRIPGSRKIFFCSPVVQTGSGDLSIRVKRTGLEADHSSQTTVEVNNVWRFTSTPPYMPSCPVQGQLHSGIADL